VRSLAERLAAAAVVLTVLALAACEATATPSPSAPSASPLASESDTPQPTSPTRASPTPEPTAAVDVPEPGRPWDGTTLLREMAASTRPDGVPASMQTLPVADALADAIWTVDGATWDTFAIGGFCGSTTCTLEVAGTHLSRAGEDLWVVEVDPASARVEVIDADVRSLPPELVEELDALARAGVDLDGMILGTARWLPPPADAGRFELSYRSGGEEGSCRQELVLDATSGEIVEETATAC
jgi:hypothetical protein